ncbi:hypothetical protein AYW79_14830 [Ferroacidibacillus organovorans]|uniref:Uncharacterized protein n=1 Tax=Ferroacidibacillus organovorans TaxID=1765683 RepID=A0A853K6X9_9BACL|nr:hypothetical protein AYJ22_15345 [Ferroacidibacillus organovorans]OAG86832.1 hypothetical protein AYW79_14830 [Ferroacidibacillus organovorans]
MDQKLSVAIVRSIYRDIMSRYGLDGYFQNIPPRSKARILETWVQLVSEELHKSGVISNVCEPLNVDEMDLADVIDRINYFSSSGDDI